VDLYDEVCRPHHLRRIRMVEAPHGEARALMDLWLSMANRPGYGPPPSSGGS
jgi:hypothetical protein